MAIYPGGSRYDHTATRYVFLANFFSDLGATRTQSGATNTAAAALFIAALGSVGAALIYFAPTWSFLTGGARSHRIRGIVAQVAGTLAGVCFIGIAATPHNLDQHLHLQFVKSAFVLLLCFVVPFTSLLHAFRWPRSSVWAGVAYVIALVAYVINLFVGPSLRTPWGFQFQVVTQKAIVYYSVVTVAVLALEVRRQAAAHFAAQRIAAQQRRSEVAA
jgi:hypothetical protein